MKKKRIALFHPWIKSKGGSERVVLELMKEKEYDIDLYTWVYDSENTFEEFKDYKINVIGLNILRKFSRKYISRGLFAFNALFSKIPLNKYDLFFISTSGMGELITLRNYKKNKTITYVHTILRASYKPEVKWNIKYRYNNILLKFLYLILIEIYRVFERISWKRINYVIFNSELSKTRANEHNLINSKKSSIVYPPIDIERFLKLKPNKGDYFLYISRINKLKRQDFLIKAWKNFVKKHPKEKLIIAGNVENKKYLKEIKDFSRGIRNIKILSSIKEGELDNLYKNSKAVIFIPYMEDFGIVPFEALASGKPLLAVDKGGYVKLIEDIPQYYKIKERESEKDFILEIERALEKFLKSKEKPKKIKNL